MSGVPFAWTSQTSQADRDLLKQRLMTGVQPIAHVAESLRGALLESVRTAAANGRLRALVVDEAHLITQWGVGFRPEFRLLGDLARTT